MGNRNHIDEQNDELHDDPLATGAEDGSTGVDLPEDTVADHLSEDGELDDPFADGMEEMQDDPDLDDPDLDEIPSGDDDLDDEFPPSMGDSGPFDETEGLHAGVSEHDPFGEPEDDQHGYPEAEPAPEPAFGDDPIEEEPFGSAPDNEATEGPAEGDVIRRDMIGEEGYYAGDLEQEYPEHHHEGEVDEFGMPVDESQFEEFEEADEAGGRRQESVDPMANNTGPSKKRAAALVAGILLGLGGTGYFIGLGTGLIGGSGHAAQSSAGTSNASPEEVQGVEQAMNDDMAQPTQARDPMESDGSTDVAALPVEDIQTPSAPSEPTHIPDVEPTHEPSDSGLSEDEVQAMIDESVSQALASQKAEVPEDLLSLVDTLQSTVKSQNETLEVYREEIVSINKRMEELKQGGDDEKVSARLADLEKSMRTALANSRIALRTSKGLEDKVAGGSNKSSTPTKSSSSTSKATKGKDLSDWNISGIGGNRALIQSPSGESFIVSPGDRVPGLGRVLSIENQTRSVETQSGTIQGS